MSEDDDGPKVPLMDLNESPFKDMKKKKEIKPSVEILREEVKRRSECNNSNNDNKPKPNGWTAKKCYEWLNANPITTEEDVAFLSQRAKAVKQVVANATQKVISSSSNPSVEVEQGNRWFGPLPYLRLIHCLLEDDIKAKWIHRGRAKTIQEIDARRSDVREEDVHETIAKRWNCTSFNPTTMVSNCHYDFSQEIDIGFDATSEFARATPSKVKEKLAKLKTDLTLIVDKWERSGQGDGGVVEDDPEEDDEAISNDEDDDVTGNEDAMPTRSKGTEEPKFEWGRSTGRTGAFDCRESFLGSNPSYLLYYWDILDQNDLFNTSFNRMSDEAGASSANDVPPLIRTTKSSAVSTHEDVTVIIQSFSEAIDKASKETLIAADRRYEQEKKEKERRHKEILEAEEKRLQQKSTAAENRVILQAKLETKGYLKRRIDDLEDEARRVRFKIFEAQTNTNKTEETFYNEELRNIQTKIENCQKEMGDLK